MTVTILALAGKLTLGQGDRLLKDKISSVVRDGPKRLLLDLSEGTLRRQRRTGRTRPHVYRRQPQRRTTEAAGPWRKRIKDLFALTKLLTVFENLRDRTGGARQFLLLTGGLHLAPDNRRLRLRLPPNRA